MLANKVANKKHKAHSSVQGVSAAKAALDEQRWRLSTD